MKLRGNRREFPVPRNIRRCVDVGHVYVRSRGGGGGWRPPGRRDGRPTHPMHFGNERDSSLVLPACLPARLDCPPRLLSFLPSSKKRISDGDNLSHLQSWFNEQACGKTAASDVTGRGRSGAGVSRPSFPRQHGRTDGPTTYYIRFKGRQARQGNFVALKR